MNVETSTVTKLYITGVQNLDPITVFLEDFKPKHGKITVSCWGKSWTAQWGGMWDGMTVGQFFCELSAGYIIGYFDSQLSSRQFSGDALVGAARRQILKDRRALDIGQDEARELYDDAEGLREATSIEVLHYAHHELMQKLFGDEWWHLTSSADATEPNPDYAYLERIIAAVQQALAKTVTATAA